MADYIERDALRKILRESAVAKYPVSFYVGLFAAADEVEKMPAADVAPVVHGRWIGSAFDMACSACGIYQSFHIGRTKYCPNCGARMDGE